LIRRLARRVQRPDAERGRKHAEGERSGQDQPRSITTIVYASGTPDVARAPVGGRLPMPNTSNYCAST